MRVIIDRDRCLGNGLCESVAAPLFELGDDDVARFHPGEWDERHRAALEQAVQLCPTQAISIRAEEETS